MSHLTLNHGWDAARLYSNNLILIWGSFGCDNCNAVNIAIKQITVQDYSQIKTRNDWEEQEKDAEWYPMAITGKDFLDVPPHIAEAASEAYRCRSISAFRASVLLARSVIEAIAKDKGITKGDLMAKIGELFNQGFIREHICDGAHEVRFLGNEMAHGDFIIPITSEERELALILMSEIIDEVYQSPARVAAARAARAARHASAS